MKIIDEPRAMQQLSQQWRCENLSIGFVPTMGALHDGHLSLLRAARENDARVVASIFVNPTQFAPHEDLNRYPRPFERDCDLLREAGCDALFAPTPQAMYGDNFSADNTASTRAPQTFVEVNGLDELWEGAARPGHLRGVATVVAMLFNIVRADNAYFGEKDFQQLRVVEKMARDLHFETRVIGCETQRDADGLALSSRNAYLSPDERDTALCLNRALQRGVQLAKSGERDAAKIVAAMQEICDASPLVETEYIAIVDAQTLAPLPQLGEKKARSLIAARVGKTRLIDNAGI